MGKCKVYQNLVLLAFYIALWKKFSSVEIFFISHIKNLCLTKQIIVFYQKSIFFCKPQLTASSSCSFSVFAVIWFLWSTSYYFWYQGTIWTTISICPNSRNMLTILINFCRTPMFCFVFWICRTFLMCHPIEFKWQYASLISAWTAYCCANWKKGNNSRMYRVTHLLWKQVFSKNWDQIIRLWLIAAQPNQSSTGVYSELRYFMWGFVATRPHYYDTYVYHYVYICNCSAISWHFLFRPDGIKTLIYNKNYSVYPSYSTCTKCLCRDTIHGAAGFKDRPNPKPNPKKHLVAIFL